MRYQQIVRTVSETPWAILPSKLAAIQELVALRAAGDQLSEKEIQAAIGGRPSTRQPESVGTVAILPLYGVLMPRADIMSQISGATSLERWAAAFHALLAMDEVSALVIDIDSPGGSTDLVTETAAIIREARGDKPIVAVANACAGSAAYWLASQADEVVSTPSGSVGSVGVLAAHTDISGLQEKAGIKTTLITFGANKAELSPYAPLSDDARAALQDRIDKMGAMFVADVAAGRGVSEKVVQDSFGGGRMLPAADALNVGMIDRIDTLEATVERLLQDAMDAPATLAPRARAQISPPLGATILNPHPEAAKSGLSFTDEAVAARDAVQALVDRTLSLAEVRRGRLTAAKRDQLKTIADSLNESAASINELLSHTDPHRRPNLDDVKASIERVRAETL